MLQLCYHSQEWETASKYKIGTKSQYWWGIKRRCLLGNWSQALSQTQTDLTACAATELCLTLSWQGSSTHLAPSPVRHPSGTKPSAMEVCSTCILQHLSKNRTLLTMRKLPGATSSASALQASSSSPAHRSACPWVVSWEMLTLGRVGSVCIVCCGLG